MKTMFVAAVAAAVAAPVLSAVVQPSVELAGAPSLRMDYPTEPASDAGLYLFPARTDGAKPIRKLKPEDYVCPEDKITVMCKPKGDAKYAEFYIGDTRRRQENVMPYILTGDRDGYASEWKPTKTSTVKCTIDGGDEEYMSKLMIKCGDDTAPPMPPADPTRPPMTEPATRPPMPPTRPPTMPPTRAPTMPPTRAPTMPPTRAPTMPPTRAPTMPQTQPKAPAPPPSGNVCLRIPATGYMGGSLPEGWKPKKGGIVYKDGGDGKIEKPPKSDDVAIMYEFTAKFDGFHAITMESETPHPTEHNDMFIQFPQGIVRRKGDVVKAPTKEWLKVYQGTKTKSWRAFTTDHYGDSLSTAIKLKKGNKYVIKVAGRSTRFILHNIGVFPCDGKTCSRQDPYFRDTEREC